MGTQWHLHCHDAHSNEIIADALRGLQAVDNSKEYTCADGKLRYLYDVPDYSFANRFKRSEKELKAKLTIFRSQNNGTPDEWAFPKKETALDKLKKKSDQLKVRLAAA